MQPPVIHVVLERSTERARYAVQQMLGTLLGWQVRWASEVDDPSSVVGPILLYGHGTVEGAFHVRPAGLLEATGTAPVEPRVVQESHQVPLLFPTSGGDLPFDPFAAAFFLLTRYEEYAPVPKDAHGRPHAEHMHAHRHGYVQRPVVDEWALMLAAAWRAKDPRVPLPQRTYRSVQTVDLDNGFKYLGRPAWRSAGSLLRDLLRGQWHEVPRRLRVLGGLAPDPFDIYEDLRQRWQGRQRTIFFVLCALRGPHDHAVRVEHPVYFDRLRTLAGWAEVGVHPSYRSMHQETLIDLQKSHLANHLGREVRIGRQHFLRFELPGTFRAVEALAMEEEHSMGFHEMPGFRAGTCTPFAWYDLEAERSSTLRIHPFAVMDNTLRVKMGLDPDQAVAMCETLIQRVRAVQGTFTGLWHESYLAQGKRESPWREAIHRIVQAAQP